MADSTIVGVTIFNVHLIVFSVPGAFETIMRVSVQNIRFRNKRQNHNLIIIVL